MLVLECVGRAVDGGQAVHGGPHEDQAAGLWPQRPVTLIPKVLHDQVIFRFVVLVEASVENWNAFKLIRIALFVLIFI